MDKVSPKHYFMVGIGGIGMQALADVLLGMGHKITGSNIVDFDGKDRLTAKGVKVIIGSHQAESVPPDTNELIYTSAIKSRYPNVNEHPEVARALELKIPVSQRSVFIGKLMSQKIGIAVAGTHGKTTTATLITLILQKAGLDPTALIGAEVKSLSGAGFYGKGDYMVVEACEYDRSFLDMHPKIAVVTNIDEDHLDYYQDITEIKAAFKQFIELVPPEGLIVACGDDANVAEILPGNKVQVVTFGFADSNKLCASQVNYVNGRMNFTVNGAIFSLGLPGRHIVLDALAAIAVAKHIGISNAVIREVLYDFKGARRRFEILGTARGVTFVDDYGHHPTEIQAVLASMRDYFANRKVRVVFQPHQFSRTRLLLNSFAQSFKLADEVTIAPILPVRDSQAEQNLINSYDLAEKINQVSHNAKAMDNFAYISDYLNQNLQAGDVVLSLGAGENSAWVHNFYQQYQAVS